MTERNTDQPNPPETMDEAYEMFGFINDYTSLWVEERNYADCLYHAQCIAQYLNKDVEVRGYRHGEWHDIETVPSDYFDSEIFKLKKKLAVAVTELATLRVKYKELKEECDGKD